MKKYKSAADHGNEFELLFDSWCEAASIYIKKDETLTNSKRRRKDKSVDRVVVYEGNEYKIELKSIGQDRKVLDYDITNGPKNKNKALKFHQIAELDFLIIKYRPNNPILITKEDLLKFIAFNDKNNLNYDDALKIGVEVEGMEWLQNLKQ